MVAPRATRGFYGSLDSSQSIPRNGLAGEVARKVPAAGALGKQPVGVGFGVREREREGDGVLPGRLASVVAAGAPRLALRHEIEARDLALRDRHEPQDLSRKPAVPLRRLEMHVPFDLAVAAEFQVERADLVAAPPRG